MRFALIKFVTNWGFTMYDSTERFAWVQGSAVNHQVNDADSKIQELFSRESSDWSLDWLCRLVREASPHIDFSQLPSDIEKLWVLAIGLWGLQASRNSDNLSYVYYAFCDVEHPSDEDDLPQHEMAHLIISRLTPSIDF